MAFYNSNIVGVSKVNLFGKVLDANDYFLNVIGYTRRDLKQDKIKWTEMTPVEYVEKDKEAVQSLMSTGIARPWEKEYIRKDGRRVSIIIAAALLDPETTETMALVLDISERKEIERSKDEFVSVASHELKTPVTSIKLFSEILQGQAQALQQPDIEESATIIVTQINRLTSLISDLLDVSRIQADKMQLSCQTVNIDTVIQNTIRGMPNLKKSHEIIHKPGARTKIRIDKGRISQVLSNLLTNAVKYSPKANKVIVKTKQDREGITISVQDFGYGIPREEQGKIFSRFFRTATARNNNIPGFGLGLHISNEIIKKHGGTLTVKSDAGKGSCFSVFLPFKKRQAS
jgi:PAS domain S-box-containing protein